MFLRSVCLSLAILLASAVQGQTFMNPESLEQVFEAKKNALKWLRQTLKDFKVDPATKDLTCVVWANDHINVEDFDLSESHLGTFQVAYRARGYYQPISMGTKDLESCYRLLYSVKDDKLVVIALDEGAGSIIDAENSNPHTRFTLFDLKTKELQRYDPNDANQYVSLRKCLATLHELQDDGGSENNAKAVEEKKYDLHDFKSANALKVFEAGIEIGRKYAKANGFTEIYYVGTGIRAKGVEAIPFSAIEVQGIYGTKNGKSIALGEVLPEREDDHLGTLKSPKEVGAIIIKMIDAKQ